MQFPAIKNALGNFVVTHPLDPDDASVTSASHETARPMKGKLRGIAAREAFDAMMERVLPRYDVSVEADTVGGVPGIWVHPVHRRPDEAILHLHAGWFTLGTAQAFRHFVAHIAARSGASAFIPDYRLAPEHPFPAAVDDVLASYRGLEARGIRRIALTGDSAGGNLALGLAARVCGEPSAAKTALVGVVALSPVTDLTLSGESYLTRADAEPYFTLEQVAELVHAYLSGADCRSPLASPLHGRLSGLPPVRIHVGNDEVLLDDSLSYVERAVAAGTDARLDVWMGMPHGFAGSIGGLKASVQVLDAIGLFLTEQLHGGARPAQ